MYKKFMALLMTTILVFAASITTFAADGSLGTKIYRAEDGSILKVTCLEENADGGNYTITLDGDTFTDVYGSYWNISGVPSRSSDGKITFSDGQLLVNYEDGSVGAVMNEEGMLLRSNNNEDTSYYFVRNDEEKNAQDNSVIWFKIIKTYKLLDTNKVTATPTSSSVLVNGKAVAFDAYNIGGNNYFKLRDLAKTLSGTEKQFEVTWDNEKKVINLISGKAYTAVGGEMKKGDGLSKSAVLSSSSIYKDGQLVSLTAYTIGGNNYFKLRDIGKAFDFGVSWDGKANTVSIDTSIGYETGDVSSVPQASPGSKPSLGVVCITIDSKMASSFDIPVGAAIKEVKPSSPAELAGAKAGDIIVKFDGHEVNSVEALLQILDSYGSGDAKMVVYRDGDYIELTVTFK